MKEDRIKIIIGGDLVPTASNERLFEQKKMEALIGKELKEKLKSSDLNIYNLEAPITTSTQKLTKYGPNIKISPKTINGINTFKPLLLNLANNHIMDYRVEGLNNTIKILKDNQIEYIGVGENIFSIKKSYIFFKNNIKLGFYTCAEHEFSIATEDKAGVEPFNIFTSIREIEKLKKECNYVIVLYHGGKEHYRYPSPELKKICNQLVDVGADIVICQHSHCIGSYEKYRNGTIIYGQGNFIFDDEDNEYWATSLLVELDFYKEDFKIDYIPIIKEKNGVRIPKISQKNKILEEFNRRSVEILEKNFIEDKYREFSINNIYNYLYSISLIPRIIRGIDKKILKNRLIKFLYRDRMLAILNYIECEAHRELFICGLKEKIKEVKGICDENK